MHFAIVYVYSPCKISNNGYIGWACVKETPEISNNIIYINFMCIIQQYLQYLYEHNVETTDKTIEGCSTRQCVSYKYCVMAVLGAWARIYCNSTKQGPLLLIWINLNSSIDK